MVECHKIIFGEHNNMQGENLKLKKRLRDFFLLIRVLPFVIIYDSFSFSLITDEAMIEFTKLRKHLIFTR